jgi:transcriptional regulator with XRE-family HTH domain
MQTEFNHKLQQLRKESGLTQEQLAGKLNISRTAVSKWESGRGFPNIEALKNISKIFHIPVDDLLSNQELLCITRRGSCLKTGSAADLVFGICDIVTLSFIFLPLYGEKTGGHIKSVNLLHYTNIPNIKFFFYLLILLLTLTGIIELIIGFTCSLKWQRKSRIFSLILHSCTVLLFAATREPYATSLIFILLLIKTGMLFRKNSPQRHQAGA